MMSSVIASLLYSVTRKLLMVPAVLLRRGTTRDAELLVLCGTRTPSCVASWPERSAMSPLTGSGSLPCPG